MADLGFCEDCELDGDETPATQEWDVPGYPKLCDRCAQKRMDAYEPPTFDEALAHACREGRG